MKRELQRIAIASYLGHTNVRMWGGECIASMGVNTEGQFWGSYGISDYLNDLNAMHEVEKSLSYEPIEGGNLGKYLDELVEIACSKPAHPSGYTTAVMATAAQRAEAYLKAINKWEA